MKHNWKITILLLSMFLLTQFIGLYVINSDPFHVEVTQADGTMKNITNPILSAMQPPEVQQQSDFTFNLGLIIFSFIIAIVILFLLIKFKINAVLRVWFFSVMVIAMFVTFSSLFRNYIDSIYFIIPALFVALGLSFIKVFKRNFIIHNLTELLIYPGIALLFVSMLNFWSVIVLLLLISAYDMWAVWHSGIMQKMAKYQMNNLKVFSGFFIPYIPRNMRLKLKKLKKDKKFKNKKIKVNIAILGGGDVVFPIITAGVMLNLAKQNKFPSFLSSLATPLFNVPGLIAALFVTAGATLGLGLLFAFSEKKKFYPAMPFITAGMLVGIILSYLLL